MNRKDELKRLYLAVYRGDESAWEDLEALLRRAEEEKPAGTERPGPRRGADPAGVLIPAEDLPGALDRLRSLGFRWVQAEGEFRSAAEARAVMDACRARGMLAGADLELGFTRDSHPWAVGAKAGEESCRKRYFFYDTPDLPNAYEQGAAEELPDTAPGGFTWCGEAGKLVMTTFRRDEWDLNWAYPPVFRDRMEALLGLCAQGADIIRLKSVPYLWKAPGTSCRNLKQAHSLLRLIRLCCDAVYPETLLIAETAAGTGGDTAWLGSGEAPEAHLAEGGELPAALWHTAATRNTRLLAREAGRRPGGLVSTLRGGDGIRWCLDDGFLRREHGWEPEPHRQYLTDFLTGRFPGSPARGIREDGRIRGTAADLTGITAARERRDAAAGAEAERRDAMMHALVLTMSGLPLIRAEDAEAIPTEMTRLLTLRESHAAFGGQAEVRVLATENDQVLGLERSAGGERLTALFNFSRDPQEVWLREEGTFTDLTAGEACGVSPVRVEGGGFRWLVREGIAV